MLEITGCLWPLQKQKYIDKITRQKQEKCSAFIATGSATKDGKIVMAHSTFDEFWNQQWGNVLLNIKTDDNQELFMQTFPGYI